MYSLERVNNDHAWMMMSPSQNSWASPVACRVDGTGMAQTLHSHVLHYLELGNGEGIDRYHFRGQADSGGSMAPC